MIAIIKNKIEFNSIFKKSEQIFTNYFILKYCKNNSGLRYGISVSKKNFKLAVTRNKIKRQVRAIMNFDKDFESIKKDIIIIVRKKYDVNSFQKIKKDLEINLKKIKNI